MNPLSIFILVLILAGTGFIYFLFYKKRTKEALLGSFDMVLFLIMMPKYGSQKEKSQNDEKNLIGQMEQVYTNFLRLKKGGFFDKLFRGSPRIALEIASQIGGSDISFYVGVPKYLSTALEKYIQGVYPDALIEKVPEDYTIFEPAGFTAASYLKLRESVFFPINTYKNFEKDPLASITNALSKIAPEEGGAIQLIIRPCSQSGLRKMGEKIISKIREGKSVKAAISEVYRSPVIKILSGAVNVGIGQIEKSQDINKDKIEGAQAYKRGLQIDEKTIQLIQGKIQKQVFETNIRLVASAQTIDRAQEILDHLEGAFGQFSLISFNGFVPVRAKKRRLKKLIYDFSFRNFTSLHANLLNIEEIASIYHFPTQYIETPYIKSAKSSVAPPPAELPDKGLVLIGKVDYRGEEKKISFATREDRRRHFYIIGQTGSGKTGLLRELIRQDITNGEGVGVIDPHGELIDSILANMPAERVEDVVLFEPFDLERPIGLNMLEYETPEQKDFAVQEMIAIFHKLFPPEIIGPMFEHYMRNAMLALMADQADPGTLVEIPMIFTDDSYMESKLKKVANPLVRSFWLREWKQTTGATKSDMLGYVVSKVGRFVENDMMRNIIGQNRSGFDLAKIMNEKKIFLANLSKGLTGEINSSLLGLILVSKMQMAAMKRTRISEEERNDFYLYIDEFQNFTTDSIATILSEARKYRLNLTMAHQYIPQLRPEIRDAVLGNVGTIGAFRVGADDAEFLEKQFEPEFTRFDLMNLDNFNLVLKMLIGGKISSPFKAQTVIPQKGNPDAVASYKKLFRLKYGRPKELVEAEILQRSNLNISNN